MARSDRNLIRRNDLLGFEGPSGLSASASDRNEIVDNIASALPGFGIAVGGSHNWIAHNTAFGDSRPDQGLRAAESSWAPARETSCRAILRRETPTESRGRSDQPHPGGVQHGQRQPRRRHRRRQCDTTLRANTANNNGDLGIEAVPGVRDAGGNRASGNGNPLQCLNVFCM